MDRILKGQFKIVQKLYQTIPQTKRYKATSEWLHRYDGGNPPHLKYQPKKKAFKSDQDWNDDWNYYFNLNKATKDYDYAHNQTGTHGGWEGPHKWTAHRPRPFDLSHIKRKYLTKAGQKFLASQRPKAYNRMHRGSGSHLVEYKRKRKSKIRNADIPRGLTAKPEFKYKDIVYTGTLSTTIAYLGSNPINGVIRGVEDDMRMSRTITILSLFLTGRFEIEGTSSSSDGAHKNILRYGFIINHQTNQAYPDWSEVFLFTTSTNQLRNPKFMKKYTIIHDRRVNVTNADGHSGTNHTSVDDYILINWYKKMRLVTRFEEGTQTINGIGPKSLFLFAYTENATPTISYNLNTRIKFMDGV